jgi:hypothetical protein
LVTKGDASRHNNIVDEANGVNGGATTNEHVGQHTLDTKVQIHKLVNEAFTRYDNM